jgi:hypothetical protein
MMFRGPVAVLRLVKSYTICYVICKLNDFRDAACPAAVAGFPIEGLENLICLRPKTV